MKNRRTQIFRRDLNDLVRDEKGRVSAVKIGLLVGQWVAVKMLLEHSAVVIDRWDSLAILFTVLIAPDLFKKLVTLKWGK